MSFGGDDIALTNAWHDACAPSQIIEWSAKTFGTGLVMSSSFGAESAAMLHLVTQRLPDIPVIVIDTGFLFLETHEFMAQLRRRMNLNVATYRPQNNPLDYL